MELDTKYEEINHIDELGMNLRENASGSRLFEVERKINELRDKWSSIDRQVYILNLCLYSFIVLIRATNSLIYSNCFKYIIVTLLIF